MPYFIIRLTPDDFTCQGEKASIGKKRDFWQLGGNIIVTYTPPLSYIVVTQMRHVMIGHASKYKC